MSALVEVDAKNPDWPDGNPRRVLMPRCRERCRERRGKSR